MFRYYDYNDLLGYFFMKTNSYEVIELKDIFRNEILIDQKHINVIANERQISVKNILQQNFKDSSKISIIKQGNLFQQKKSDINSIQDIIFSIVKFQTLQVSHQQLIKNNSCNEYNQKAFKDFLQSNTFFRTILNQSYLNETFSKLNKKQYTFIQSPNIQEFQILYENFVNKNFINFIDPIIFIYQSKIKDVYKLCYEDKKYILIKLSLKKLAQNMGMSLKQMRKVLFFGLAIFSLSSKYKTKYCLIKNIIKDSIWKIQSQKDSQMDELFIQYKELFMKLSKQELSFSSEYLTEFCKEFYINFSGIEQFLKNYQENLIFNYVIQKRCLLNVQSKEYKLVIVPESFETLIFQQMHYLDLIPLDFKNIEEKQQKFLIITQNKFYYQQNELNYLFSKNFFYKNQRILRNFLGLFNHNDNLKIIIKHLYGQEFHFKTKQSNGDFNFFKFRLNQKPRIQNFLSGYCKNEDEIYSKFNDSCIYQQVLNLSYLYFFNHLQYLNLNQKEIQPSMMFLYKMSLEDNFEESLILLELIKLDFFNEKSFLNKKFFHELTPDFQTKQYHTISDKDFQKYKQDNFFQCNYEMMGPVNELANKEPSQINKQLWAYFIDQNYNVLLMQENQRNIIFDIVNQVYLINPEKQLIDSCWENLRQFSEKNYDKIDFLVSFLNVFQTVKYSSFGIDFGDIKSYRQQETINAIKNKFQQLIISFYICLTNHLNLYNFKRLKKFMKFIPFQKKCITSNGSLLKELLYFVQSYEKFGDKVIALRPYLLEQIKNLCRKTLQKDQNVLEFLQNKIQFIQSCFYLLEHNKQNLKFYDSLKNALNFNRKFLKKLHKIDQAHDMCIFNKQFIIQKFLQ